MPRWLEVELVKPHWLDCGWGDLRWKGSALAVHALDCALHCSRQFIIQWIASHLCVSDICATSEAVIIDLFCFANRLWDENDPRVVDFIDERLTCTPVGEHFKHFSQLCTSALIECTHVRTLVNTELLRLVRILTAHVQTVTVCRKLPVHAAVGVIFGLVNAHGFASTCGPGNL
jgi:hypothetical protein